MIRLTTLLALVAVAGAVVAGCSESRRNGGAGGAASPTGPPLPAMPYVTHTSPAGQRWAHPVILDTPAQVAAINSEIDGTIPEGSTTGDSWADAGGPARGLMIWIVHHEWWSPQLPDGGRGYSVRGEHSRSGGWIAAQIPLDIPQVPPSGARLPSLAHEYGHALGLIPDDGPGR